MSIGLTFGGFAAISDKTFTDVGPMSIAVQVDTPGDCTFNETIANDTGVTWTGFHWELSQEFGFITIEEVTDITPFATLSAVPGDMADMNGGMLPWGSVFEPELIISVSGEIVGGFVLTQVPTVAVVPGPSAPSLFLAGILGLSFAGWRRDRAPRSAFA